LVIAPAQSELCTEPKAFGSACSAQAEPNAKLINVACYCGVKRYFRPTVSALRGRRLCVDSRSKIQDRRQ